MGPGGCAARRVWTLLWRRALSSGAGSAVSEGPRIRLLTSGRPSAGPALSRACLTPYHARGLHGGPGLEEREEGAADEGRPESDIAGTGRGGGRRRLAPGSQEPGPSQGGSEFPS